MIHEQEPNMTALTADASHDRAMTMVREALAETNADWETPIEFATRSAGTFRVTRRTVLVHLLMRSVRHYAQLATIARLAGVKPEFAMDYLMMGRT